MGSNLVIQFESIVAIVHVICVFTQIALLFYYKQQAIKYNQQQGSQVK